MCSRNLCIGSAVNLTKQSCQQIWYPSIIKIMNEDEFEFGEVSIMGTAFSRRASSASLGIRIHSISWPNSVRRTVTMLPPTGRATRSPIDGLLHRLLYEAFWNIVWSKYVIIHTTRFIDRNVTNSDSEMWDIFLTVMWPLNFAPVVNIEFITDEGPIEVHIPNTCIDDGIAYDLMWLKSRLELERIIWCFASCLYWKWKTIVISTQVAHRLNMDYLSDSYVLIMSKDWAKGWYSMLFNDIFRSRPVVK